MSGESRQRRYSTKIEKKGTELGPYFLVGTIPYPGFLVVCLGDCVKYGMLWAHCRRMIELHINFIRHFAAFELHFECDTLWTFHQGRSLAYKSDRTAFELRNMLWT
jgi:hypothetical protein